MTLVCEIAVLVVALRLSLRLPFLLATSFEFSLNDLATSFKELQAALEVAAVLGSHSAISAFTKCVRSYAEGGLVGESTGDLTLELVLGLTNDGGIID